MNNKRRAKENPHPLLGVGRNIERKDEEKVEVLDAFFCLRPRASWLAPEIVWPAGVEQ